MSKFYVTKYALTAGIKEIEGEVKTEGSNQLVYDSHWNSYRVGSDCFLSLKEAIDKAESMRKNKIESLQKQIDKLKSIKFIKE